MERMKEMRMDFCFVCFCNLSSSSLSFSLSFGVCVRRRHCLFSFFWCVCVLLTDRYVLQCTPAFVLVNRKSEGNEEDYYSVCLLSRILLFLFSFFWCCFLTDMFSSATPAFSVNGKRERSEEYHCVCFFRFLFCCSFECYGCGDDDDGGGGADSRVPKHPGGSLIYVKAGQDCTQLFESYHPLYVR